MIKPSIEKDPFRGKQIFGIQMRGGEPFVWGDDDFLRVGVEVSCPPRKGRIADDIVFAHTHEIKIMVVGFILNEDKLPVETC